MKRETVAKSKVISKYNYAQIDLRHNSSLSEFLKSSSTEKILNIKERDNNPILEKDQEEMMNQDKILPFNFDLLYANETEENKTDGKYINFNSKYLDIKTFNKGNNVRGKAKKINKKMESI